MKLAISSLLFFTIGMPVAFVEGIIITAKGYKKGYSTYDMYNGNIEEYNKDLDNMADRIVNWFNWF